MLGRSTALTHLSLHLNPYLGLQAADVNTVFAHLRRLCELHISWGQTDSGGEMGCSADTLRAVIRLGRECPWLDVDVSP